LKVKDELVELEVEVVQPEVVVVVDDKDE